MRHAPVAEALSSLQDASRQHILLTIDKHGGNLRRSAQELGISRTALYNKLHLWQIDMQALRRRG